jgi:uncharacterized Zn finger protein (UPF0148 family)
LKCLDPPLLRTPRGDWFCDECKNKPSVDEEKAKEEGEQKKEGEEEVQEMEGDNSGEVKEEIKKDAEQ